MRSPPSALLRAVAGLAEGSGRTLIIAGGQYSGKTEFLQAVRAELETARVRVLSLEGSYRDRGVPYGATAGLLELIGRPPATTLAQPEEETEKPARSPLAAVTDEPVRGRRGRGDRHPLVIPSIGYVSRPRPAEFVNPAQAFERLVERLRAPDAVPIGILVEDGAYFDTESREVLLYLSERARLRPYFLGIVLDTSVPAYTSWEERLVGRGDVDWVRLSQQKPDPRDVARIKERFEALPDTTRRVLGYLALFGGSATDTYLSHAARVPSKTVRAILAPALEAGLIKFDDHQVTFPRPGWATVIADQLPYGVRETMHREIADAILAFHTEPNVHRRVQLAEHVYASQRGPEAIRYLREAAEVTDRLHAFDTSEELVADALTCPAGSAESDGIETDARLRLWRSRLLVYTGRPSEAERDLVEGVTLATARGPPTDESVEAVEELWPALRVVGPRPSLITALGELADRAHLSTNHELEVLFLSLMAEHELWRGRGAVARRDAERATLRAEQMDSPVVSAVADLTQVMVRLDGFHDDREAAGALLQRAATGLESMRRIGFQARVDDLRAELCRIRGERPQAISIRTRAISDAIRLNSLVFELEHQVGLAEVLNEIPGKEPQVASAVRRGRELADQLHLLPPSPALLRLMILEGRYLETMNLPEGAREHWSALADLPPPNAPPRLRAESLLRLVALESRLKNWTAVRGLLVRLKSPELEGGLRQGWREWVERMYHHIGPGAEGFIEPPADASTLPKDGA